MRPVVLSIILVFSGLGLVAQQIKINGLVLDEEKKPLPYATVSLLKPEDSTLMHYAISNESGQFEMKAIPQGTYIYQVAAYGYQTWVQLKAFNKDTSVIIPIEPVSNKLDEVTIQVAPVLIKKDTIEYNASSFKTRPDANTEELLKKLPGVEVDRNGNVKAQGENVSKVLVDGKEFFGDDPKVATKNLPADAIKKVQVFDKKSEDAEVTGIDDGSNQKVINLVLKDGKKSAVLGDVMAGYGTDNHYQGAAKIYRFKKESQFAAMGMLNNINQFGFTLTDYLSFSGGLRSLTDGDGLGNLFNGNSNLPVNFGQPITGLIESGAGGVNYTIEKTKGKRFNVSYMGNASRKKLQETTFSENFTNDYNYLRYDTLNENTTNAGNNFQLNWKNRMDTIRNVTLKLDASYGLSKFTSASRNTSFMESLLTNTGLYNDKSDDDQLSTNLSTTFLRKLYSKWRLFKVEVSGGYNLNNSNITSDNAIAYYHPAMLLSRNVLQQNKNTTYNTTAGLLFTRKHKNGYYTDWGLRFGTEVDQLNRLHATNTENKLVIDSLSPNFQSKYSFARPYLRLKRNNDKTEFNVIARAEFSQFTTDLNQAQTRNNVYVAFVPEVFWEYEYKNQRRLGAEYQSYLNMPQSLQLLPVTNALNPLQMYNGNNTLKPEYIHTGGLRWWIFDQFSMTTFSLNLRGTYTTNKISFARNLDALLNQTLTMVNVNNDYRADGGIDFSTPIRKLKLNVNIRLNESLNRGISLINDIQNTNINYTHSGSISFNNRKRDKWDVNTGASIRYTQAFYSLQSDLNADFYNYGYFAEVSFTPNQTFNFFVTADVTSYNGDNFSTSVLIPLLKAEVKYYFLKHKRGILSLEAFDLLNKNTGLQRVTELNSVVERNSNIIQQYFMLSFKYKLSKFDVNQGMNIEVNGKR